MALNAANNITLNVTVSTAGSYTINTPLTNGIRFSASGNFAAGTQTVTLYGSGEPTVNLDFPITVNANTQKGNNSCSTTIPVILPVMTYAEIGSSNEYSWATEARIGALTGGASFGPDGIVKMEKIPSQLWITNDVNMATDRLNNGFTGMAASGIAYNTAVMPDIVLYFAHDAAPNTALSIALANYIQKGGCVIYGAADDSESVVNILLSELFGSAVVAEGQVAGTPTTSDNDYQIINNPNDPIINGPFGNLSGRYWGEDNASVGSVIVTSLPPNSVQVCSAYNSFGKMDVNPEYSIVWHNDSMNFVYFGDSAGARISNTDRYAYPTSYSSAGLPMSKYYGYEGVSTSQYVYNAALELNAVAWALKKAAGSGINPH